MWVNIITASRMTGYTQREIKRLLDKGALPYFHNGHRTYKFELDDLIQAMKDDMKAAQEASQKKWEAQQDGARPFDFAAGLKALKVEAKADLKKAAEEQKKNHQVIMSTDRGSEFDFRSQLKRLRKEIPGKKEV